jgi:predicted nucleotidyltransferase
MKVLGIIAEYNPFHNGHAYHIEQSKSVTGCDAVVCVMSGNYIQRGEPAIINKFARAEAAIKSGADLVIELPVPFAMSSAEMFAFGAVKILDSTGIVDCISFGSEQGDISSLRLVSDILVNEPPEYKNELKRQLSLGLSFPVCRQKALKKYMEGRQISSTAGDVSMLLETSNNILGIEYLKALSRLKSSISPYTIKREANHYNSKDLTGCISSATAIRNNILTANSKDQSGLKVQSAAAVTSDSKFILQREMKLGRGPNSISMFESIILALLRQGSVDKLRDLPGISEGLEYRIKKAAETSGSIDELIDNICTKRYTRTRIQRIIFSLLAGISKSEVELFMQYGGPQYLKILGFNRIGRELLSIMKKSSMLQVITKAS